MKRFITLFSTLLISISFFSFVGCSKVEKNKEGSDTPDVKKESKDNLSSEKQPQPLDQGDNKKKEENEKVKTASDSPGQNNVDIFYIGEFEGRLLPCVSDGKEVGGFLYLSSLIKKIATPQTIILSPGNLFQGNEPEFKPVVKALNILKLTASTMGNFELNQGLKFMEKQIKKANFALLSANVYKGEARLLKPYLICECGSLKIAVIGITSQDVAVQLTPSQTEGLQFREPISEIKQFISKLEAETDYIILLSNQDPKDDIRIVEEIPKINLIIGKSTPQKISLQEIGQTLVVRLSEKRGIELGRLRLTCSGKKVIEHSNKIYHLTSDSSDLKDIPFDKESSELTEEWRKKESEREEVIGKTQVALDGSYKEVRTQETNFGSLITDVMRQANPDADIAFINGGGIRASIPSGNITYGMLEDALPYKNEMVLLELEGKVIKDVLENSVSRVENMAGCFLQVSGISFTFNPYAESLSRVSEILINGKPLEKDRIYKAVTVSFLAGGGDDYIMLKEKKPLWTSPKSLQDYIVSYLKKQKEIAPKVEGRIKTEGRK